MSAFEQRFPVSENGLIVIQGMGDVFIQGWDQSEVLVRTPDEDTALIQSFPDRLTILAQSDVEIFAPRKGKVRLEGANGDASVAGIAGYVEISRVQGDLSVRSCGKVDAGSVHGDAELLQVEGPIVLRRVGGDLMVEARNRVIAEQIGGDATISADALVRVKAGGDIHLRLNSANVEEVNARCGGDLFFSAPPDFGAELDANSGGHTLEIRLPDQTLHLEQGHYSTTLGNARTLLRLSAGGDISIELSAIPSHEQKTSPASLGSEFSEGLDRMGFSPFVEEKIRQKMEHAAQKAEERARRAEERVRRAMERVEQAQQHVEHRRRGWLGIWFGRGEKPAQPSSATAPETPAVPEVPEAPEAPEAASVPYTQVTNEERLLVLKMLQEHKITVEEAEQLLAALDGDLDVE